MHHGDLRNACRGHARLVVEDAAEMLAVGKHLRLMRQIGAAGIDEINAGQPVLERDLLRAQMLLHRHRIIGAALDGGIVGDDHRLAALDPPDAADEPRAVHVALVHAEGRERADLQERRARHRSSRATRSRAISLPRARWRTRALAPPPSDAAARRCFEFVERGAPPGGVLGLGGGF